MLLVVRDSFHSTSLTTYLKYVFPTPGSPKQKQIASSAGLPPPLHSRKSSVSRSQLPTLGCRSARTPRCLFRGSSGESHCRSSDFSSTGPTILYVVLWLCEVLPLLLLLLPKVVEDVCAERSMIFCAKYWLSLECYGEDYWYYMRSVLARLWEFLSGGQS